MFIDTENESTRALQRSAIGPRKMLALATFRSAGAVRIFLEGSSMNISSLWTRKDSQPLLTRHWRYSIGRTSLRRLLVIERMKMKIK
jgi:hypothetical protein